MDQLNVQLALGISGRAKGTPENSRQFSRIGTFNLGVITLTSTSTLGSQATNGYGPRVPTLNPSAVADLDWTNFVNTLQQSAQAFSVVRLFYLFHTPASLATSGIRVGDPSGGADVWCPFNWPDKTTLDLLPSEGLFFFAPTVTGMAVGARKRLRVTNLDAAVGHVASYEIGSFGI